MSTLKRRDIREQLLKLLYIREFFEPEEYEEQKDLYFRLFSVSDEPDEEIVPFSYDAPKISANDRKLIIERFDDIIAHIGEIDHDIEVAMSGWTLKRVSKLELSILRIAVYEIKFDEDVPSKVAIDEAVELTKLYGSKDVSYGFVNGILAKLV